MNLPTWSKMSTPTKIILTGQGLALLYAVYKKAHVTSVVTALTIAGTVLAEAQAQKTGAALPANVPAPAPTPAVVSNLSELRRLA
jgi:hypothetical protein